MACFQIPISHAQPGPSLRDGRSAERHSGSGGGAAEEKAPRPGEDRRRVPRLTACDRAIGPPQAPWLRARGGSGLDWGCLGAAGACAVGSAALARPGCGDNSEWAPGVLWLFFPGGRAMADEELEALRKQRLAELQAKHGVSAPAARPARFPARRRPRPGWRARPQAEALGAAAGQ